MQSCMLETGEHAGDVWLAYIDMCDSISAALVTIILMVTLAVGFPSPGWLRAVALGCLVPRNLRGQTRACCGVTP